MFKKLIFTVFTALVSLYAWSNGGAPVEYPGVINTPFGSIINFDSSAPVRYEPAVKLTDNSEKLDTLDFRYCQEGEAALMTGDAGDVENSAAILLPEGIVSRLAGNKITSIWIFTGLNAVTNKNHITDVTVWFRSTLDGKNIQSQKGRLSRNARTWTEIVLDKPYEVKSNEPIYVGMTVTRISQNDYVFVHDRKKNDQHCSFFVNYVLNGERRWEDWSNTYGSLCMRLTMVGNNLPENDVFVSALKCPNQVPYNASFDASFTLTNHGSNPITKVTIEKAVGNETPTVSTLTLPAPLKNYNSSTTISIPVVCKTYGSQVSVTIKVTKVNDVEDTYTDDNCVSSTLLCLEGGYQRTFVMEEGTGTWCGFCPRGAAAISRLQRLYPETFIGIAAHQGDVMQISTTFLNSEGKEVTGPDYEHGYGTQFAMMTGYPHARYSRNSIYGYEIPSNPADVENMYKHYMQLPATAKIEFDVYFSDDSKTELNVESVSEFAFDESTEIRVTFVLLENGLGPYPQSNNYAGANYDMEGWESLPGTAIVTFDHVARYIENYYGVPGSLPIYKQKKTPYQYNAKIPLSNLKRLDDFAVVGMLLNQKTGEVENAAIVHCNSSLPVKAWTNGIEEVKAETDATPEWYTIQGVKVAKPETPGVYVKVVAGKATKEYVK